MWKYIDVIVVLLGFVEGNKFRKMNTRMSVLEQRLGDNNFAIYELQDSIIDVNATMKELKSICTKEDRQNVDKAGALHIADDSGIRNSLVHAFEKEKKWVRNALSNIKRQAGNLPGNWNENLKQPIDDASLDQRIDALQELFNVNLPTELGALKRSIHDVDSTLVERIERHIVHVNNEIKALETSFTTTNSAIQTSLDKLGERLDALEHSNYKQVRETEESIKATDEFTGAYVSALSNVFGSINGALGQQCETNWEHFENSCYEFRRDKLTFPEAVLSCNRDDAYLVEMESIVEDVFIDDLVKNENVWLGSNRRDTWLRSSRRMEYSNWSAQNSFKESSDGIFAYKSNKGRWRTSPSARRRLPFVCEKAAA